MTAPEHLKISGPEDILGYIPHSLGYWPENSLVAMTMQGKRLGATLRVDLPGSGGMAGVPGAITDLAGFAATVASYLEADDEADGTLLAFFTDVERGPDAEGGPEGGPETGGTGPGAAAYADLLAVLELALAAAGMPVRDAWLIGADFWRNAYCADPSCCAPPGRPVEEIRNSRLNAEMVLRGSSVGAAPDARTAACPAPRPDPAALEAEQGWAQEFSARRRNRVQFRQVLEVWTRVLGGLPGRECSVELDPALAAYLRATLAVQAWRDAVLVMAAAGPAAAERGAEDFGLFDGVAGPPAPPGPAAPLQGAPLPPPPVPAAPLPPLEAFPCRAPSGDTAGAGDRPRGVPGYGEVLLGLAPPVPDWALMERLERTLVLLGGDGGDEARAACLTGRGWIEWCRGKGSFAHALFQQAAGLCPGYRLAELLAELGRRGTLCGWAARRDAAWQKFRPDAA
jgi:hypothetical protein